MSKILTFGAFTGTLTESVINEDRDWYTQNGYKPHAEFKTKSELVSHIEKGVNQAFAEFTKRHGIPKLTITVVEGSRGLYLQAESPKLTTQKELGIFYNCMHSAEFGLFAGRELKVVEKDGELLYDPVIWSTVNVGYSILSGNEGREAGGSNGLPWKFDDHKGGHIGSIMYSIDENKVYTYTEWWEGPGKKSEEGHAE